VPVVWGDLLRMLRSKSKKKRRSREEREERELAAQGKVGGKTHGVNEHRGTRRKGGHVELCVSGGEK